MAASMCTENAGRQGNPRRACGSARAWEALRLERRSGLDGQIVMLLLLLHHSCQLCESCSCVMVSS